MEYGLIGKKLIHSYSKEIHEQLFNCTYVLKELTDDEQLSNFMKVADFRAVNVTIPYKEKVIPYLDYISDEAKEIMAVNTIINKNGKLYGYNTDYFGLKDMILEYKIPVKNKKIFILLIIVVVVAGLIGVTIKLNTSSAELVSVKSDSVSSGISFTQIFNTI